MYSTMHGRLRAWQTAPPGARAALQGASRGRHCATRGTARREDSSLCARQAAARLEPLRDARSAAPSGRDRDQRRSPPPVDPWNRGCAGATRTQGGAPGRARTPGDRFSQAAIAIRLFGGVPGLGPAAGTLARAAGPASLLPGQAVDGGRFSGRRTA
jgi:hypothetical protein